MNKHVLYVYVPMLAEAEVRLLFQVITDLGYSITHLGKNDSPKKWSGAPEEAEKVVLSGSDMTPWTFIRDAKQRLRLEIQIHRDPRWKSSTISASMPELEPLRLLGVSLATRIKSFAAILGRSGGGKDQAWNVLHLSDDCPPDLAAKFAGK